VPQLDIASYPVQLFWLTLLLLTTLWFFLTYVLPSILIILNSRAIILESEYPDYNYENRVLLVDILGGFGEIAPSPTLPSKLEIEPIFSAGNNEKFLRRVLHLPAILPPFAVTSPNDTFVLLVAFTIILYVVKDNLALQISLTIDEHINQVKQSLVSHLGRQQNNLSSLLFPSKFHQPNFMLIKLNWLKAKKEIRVRFLPTRSICFYKRITGGIIIPRKKNSETPVNVLNDTTTIV